MKKNQQVASKQAPTRKRDPEARRRRLEDAAREEFSTKGLEGARVDEIARRAGVNKQLVYHYFGNKDGLYLHILEQTYEAMVNAKVSLQLGNIPPFEAIEKLVAFTFDYIVENRDFVALLNDENIHRGRHIKKSQQVHPTHSEMIRILDDILRRGEEDGTLRRGIDTIQFYITLSGMCYFYFANIHTLSVVFGRDLNSAEALATRRTHIIETVMASVRPN
ncbi:MAG: TetR family transcriptional regulator [Rhodospirillales bacterium]|nr:TetR family transcriptional regulator [Rhodospirillales bacterium]